MSESRPDMLKNVKAYYDGKVAEHGASSKGVDWNGIESHYLRFEQLHKLFQSEKTPSVLDYGCGYAAFFDYLQSVKSDAEYFGCDISDQMLEQGLKEHPELKSRLFRDLPADKSFDFVVASGLFNVKLDSTEADWQSFIESTLADFNRRSSRGFAFNILTSYSNEDKKRDHLHYANPMYWFDWCKQNYSRNVALLHDYELYEFTILVRK